MNWTKIIKFSATLFVTSFLIGVAQGLVIGANEDYLSVATHIGMVVSLVVEIIIFAYLAKSLEVKPFQHAVTVLILTKVTGFILLWLVSGSLILSAVMSGVVLGVLALVIGTSVGVSLRSRTVSSENA